jgi:hypothetical protein
VEAGSGLLPSTVFGLFRHRQSFEHQLRIFRLRRQS